MTSDALPEPLTPPDCDLRGMDWMPLHGNRLSGSDFEALATDAEYRAAHKLWWAAWQLQVPAASLPDDDRILAHLAGFTRDVEGWLKVKEMALHGFTKCSDGRLYHAFLATEALVAFDHRLRVDKKREADRERLAKWRETKKSKRDATPPDDTRNDIETRFNTRYETQCETPEVAATSRLRPDPTIPDHTSSLRSDGADAPMNATGEVFGAGLAIVRRLTGKPEKAARSFLGRLRKGVGDDDAELMRVLREAETAQPVNPESWLMAATARQRGVPLGRAATQRAADYDYNEREIERLMREARGEQWPDPFDGPTIEGRAV